MLKSPSNKWLRGCEVTDHVFQARNDPATKCPRRFQWQCKSCRVFRCQFWHLFRFQTLETEQFFWLLRNSQYYFILAKATVQNTEEIGFLRVLYIPSSPSLSSIKNINKYAERSYILCRFNSLSKRNKNFVYQQPV